MSAPPIQTTSPPPSEKAVSGLRLFVSNSEANSVSIADLKRMEVLQTISVGQSPADIVASEDRRYVFVALRKDDAVCVIEAAEARVVERLEVQKRPVHIYLHPEKDTIWVGNDLSGSVSVLDARNLGVRAHIPTGNGHRKIAFTKDGGLACVTNIADGTVSIVDCRSYQVLATVPSGGRGPHGIDYSVCSGRVYVCNNKDNIVGVIDPVARKWIKSIPAGKSSNTIHFTHNGRFGYVANQGEASLTVIDATDDVVSATVEVDEGPDHVIFSPDDRYAYVANTRSDNLSVVEVGSHRRVANVPVGGSKVGLMHRHISISLGGDYVSVPNPEDGTVSVVSTKDLKIAGTLMAGKGCNAMCMVGEGN